MHLTRVTTVVFITAIAAIMVPIAFLVLRDASPVLLAFKLEIWAPPSCMGRTKIKEYVLNSRACRALAHIRKQAERLIDLERHSSA